MTIFDKTDLGRNKIATRTHDLPSRLRTLLLLVNGKSDSEEVLKKVAGLGLNQAHLIELLQAGLIRNTTPLPTVPIPTIPELTVEPVLTEDSKQLQTIYRFYHATTKSMLGLHGLDLQLKIECASSIEDFRELRQTYLETIAKIKGPETMDDLRSQLDPLLYPNHVALPAAPQEPT